VSPISSRRCSLPRLAAALLTAAAAFGLSGCITAPPEAAALSGRPPVELTGVPFFPQADYQCGPAALATALSAAGQPVSAEELVAEVYVPGLQGSLQPELLAAARRRGLLPYVLRSSLEELAAELDQGRPVLVLQNLHWLGPPAWHYAVIVGMAGADSEVILRSGEERRRVEPLWRFLRSWDAADRWAVVLLEPGQLPARPDRYRYLRSVTELEASGHSSAAHAAYLAAEKTWPGDPVVRAGLGNTALAMGQWKDAAEVYSAMLAEDAGNVLAGNNLAVALVELGCPATAVALADRALAALGAEDRRRPVIEDTRSQALSRQGPREPDDCRSYGDVSLR
jgi:hypothetical protein